MQSNKENKQLLENFLNRTFFKDFADADKKEKMFDSVELQLNSKCNLNCSYCYYNRQANGKELNPNDISQNKNIENNIDLVLNWLSENKYFPGKIDIFSGETLNQEIGYKCIEKVLEFSEKNYTEKKPLIVCVPTNMSFLRSEKKTERVKNFIRTSKLYNACLSLSASVDGKYLDKKNRPVFPTTNQDAYYSDDFYEKLFDFGKKYKCGFHPMVYYEKIDKWVDNFNWFQENFKKHNLPWNNIYLLEVRNNGWTKKTIKEYMVFYTYVLDWVLKNILEEDKNAFIKRFVFNGAPDFPSIGNMNLFNNIGRIGRGVGCSLQTTLFIRMGDLVCNSCHRLSYKHFESFKLVTEKNKIVGVDPLNIDMYFATMFTEHKTWPYCESCLIKEICCGGCMGSQYETTGDPFCPIPSVCTLMHGKVKAQILFFLKHNMFDLFLSMLIKEQVTAFKLFRETM